MTTRILGRPDYRGGLVVLTLLVLCCWSGSTLADDKCRTGCQSSTPNVFKYVPGTTYKYNLEGNVDFELSSAEGQLSSSKIKATVLLTQQPDCNQVLRVQNFQVIGPDAKKYGSITNVDKPIRLNFHDGHIEDVICAEPGDTQDSLNIKRAIASLFQSAAHSGYETDVFGTCPTESSQHKEGNILTIQKSRRLNRCSHRESVQNDFISTAFNLNSELKSSPLLNSQYTSEQRVKNGIMDHVLVTETYNFLPFQIGKSGAKATVQTKLSFAGQSKENPKPKVSEGRTIIFENPHPVQSTKVNVGAIVNAVKDTAKTIGESVSENTANKFANLIRIVSVAKKDDLLTVYNQVKSGAGFSDSTIGKKVFLDALFRAGSGDAVEVAIELFKSKQLDPLEQKLVFLGLAFVKHATPNSLASAATLLDQPNLPREAYLAVGTLAGRYCASHSCDALPQLNTLTDKLIAKLADGKTPNRATENTVISILKSITNMKHLTDAVVPKLVSIAQDKKASMRVRIAALEAYMADPCKDKLRDSAISVLKDVQQDSEIRIKAYLVLAQCPNGKVATMLKTLLDNEQSYQVGGFIVSHLRNIRASANPDKELAKQQLALVNTMKKFPMDPRRFSFNNEFSYMLNTLGLSNSVESNVIYSQNSYLPRSASLNLTSEVFGHTLNFLELDVRQENLDRLVEEYFGPLGVLRNQKPEEMVKTGKEGVDKVVDYVKERFQKTRSKRDVAKEVETMGKQVQIKTNDLNNDLDLDMSVKLFGSEMLFLSINEDSQKLTPNSIIDKIFDRFDSGIENAKKFDHIIRNNLRFLDLEVSYPTSMGFPLRLSVEGTSSVQLKASGSIDIKAILSNSKDHIMKLSLIPSANVEIVARLTMDTQHVDAGLKFNPTLHTATGGAAEVEFFNSGKGVDVKFSLPVEKQQLVSINYDIVFNQRELGLPEVNTPIKFSQNKDFSICFDQLSPLIGLTLCAELNGPNPSPEGQHMIPWFLAGNSKFGASIDKEQQYEVSEYHYRNVLHLEPGKHGMELILETKGKNIVSFKVDAFISPEKYIKASLESPIKKATLEGRITDTLQEKSASLEFEHDGFKYSGKIGVAISGGGGKSVYKPLIEYRTPEKANAQSPPYTVEGQIIAEETGDDFKYTFDNVKVIIPDQQPLTVIGFAGREAGSYVSDLTVENGGNSATLKGRFQSKPDLVKFNAEFQNSMNPMMNFNVKYELQHQVNQFENTLQLTHGDLSSKTNVLKLHNLFSKKGKKIDDYEVSTKNSFSYPLLGVDAKFDFDSTPKTVDYDLEVKYNNIKVGSELDLKYNQKAKGDYDFEFEMYGFENKMALKAKRDITGEKSKIDNSLEVNGKKIEVSGLLTHHIKPQDLDIGADLTIKVPTRNDPIKWSNSLKLNPNELDSHLKISSGSIIFIDAFLKANREHDINGSVKINIEKVITANGQLTAVKGVGSANILIDFIKAGRKIKAESKYTVSKPTVNIMFVLHPNFEKDATKFSINTVNQVTAESINSKNTIEYCDKKMELNFQGQRTGNWYDGTQSGEGDVTFPNNMYLAGKFNREMKMDNGVANGKALVSLEQRDNKNAPGRKIVYKGTIKDTNWRERVMDLTYELEFEASHGQKLNSELHLIRKREGEKLVASSKYKLTTTYLKNPVEVTTSATYLNRVGDYQISSSYGPANTFVLKGAYDSAGDGKPIKGDFDMVINSENPKLKVIKLNGAGSILKPESASQELEMSGKAGIFIDDDDTSKDATVDISGESEVKVGHDHGQIKGKLNFQKQDPLAVSMSYDIKEKDQTTTAKGDFDLQYAAGKNIKADLVVEKLPLSYNIDLKVQSPEKIKDLRVQLHAKRSEDNQQRGSEMIITADGKVYTLNSEVTFSEVTPGFSASLKHPDGRMDIFAAKVNKISPKNVGAEIKIVNIHKDFTFDGTFDAHLEKVEDFNVKLTADSPKLKLDKIVIEAKSEAGKKISFSATSAGKNMVSGATTYKVRDEGGKYIVEGSGNFKVKDQDQSGNFKYSRQMLSVEKDGEQGIDVSFDAGLGSRAIDSELKVTNKQFRILNSYCEEKKQCAHFEVDSKTNTADVANYNHELEINIDLRKLGLLHEFGLKAVTTRKQFALDHTVDVHFQSEDNKYQYSLYVHPTEGGVTITTPQRIVSLESKMVPYTDASKQVSGEVALYLNKKTDPSKKTSLSGLAKLSGDEKVGTWESEVKFTSPGLSKPLSISSKNIYDVPAMKYDYTATFDVFSAPNQKLESNFKAEVIYDKENGKYGYNLDLSAKSAGMGVDITYHESVLLLAPTKDLKMNVALLYNVAGNKCQCGLKVEANPSHIDTNLKLMDREWFTSKVKLQLNKDSQVIDEEHSLFGMTPVVSHLDIKNWNSLNWVLNRKTTPQIKLTIHAALMPGQIADFRATAENNGKMELLHASIKLDEKNFLKSDYGFSLENVQKAFLDPLRKEIPAVLKEGELLSADFAKKSVEHAQKISEVAKKNAPNMKPALDYYQGEAEKIKNEVAADKTIQDMAEFWKNIFGSVVEVFTDLLARLVKITDQLAALIKTNVTKFADIFEKEIIPKLKEITDKIVHIIGEGVEHVSNIVFAVIAKASEFLDAHQAELKQLATSLSGIGQDVGRLIMINYEKARELIVQNWNRLYEELKALPIYEELKSKYEGIVANIGELSGPAVDVIQEFASTLKDLLPNDDLRKIVTDLSDYIVKKIKMEKVNDIEIIETIIQDIIIVVRKLIQQVNLKELQLSEKDFLGVNLFYDLPKIAAAKFSPLAYLQQGEFPSWSDVLYSVSFNPRHWIPPLRMYAIVMQGTQVFTFDGKHLIFPGKCNYLLARDAVDGNFSIVGSFANGAITGITLVEGADSVMIKKDGHVLVNNAASEFPVIQGHIVAFRLHNAMGISSKSGVMIGCTADMAGCTVSINGFYHGKLRGLLGNGNSEPADDFTLPNGKIVQSESDFTNAYKTTPSCAAVKTIDHSAIQRSSDCSKYFGSDSPLRLGFVFVAPDNFRTACDHAVSIGVKDPVKNTVHAYVVALWTRGVPFRVPSEFVQCTNYEKPTQIGDHFTVKLPGKAADVVITMDRAKVNEPVYKDLMQPLITQLTTEFNAQGITDVEFHLITYGGDYMEWPAHVTQGGKMTWHGKAPTVKFVDPPSTATPLTGCPKLDGILDELRKIKHDVDLVVGNYPQSKAFTSALTYPFRAQALKTMIALTAGPCPVGKLVALQKLRGNVFKTDYMTINLISPVPTFKVKDAKTTKNVIGFNEHHVFTFSDAKKKPEGGSELHKDLEYVDYCIDWTVKHRGNVFISENFQQSKGPARKQFLQVVAHNVVDQLTNVEQTMDCECKMINQFDGNNVCRIAHSEPKPDKKSGKKK